MKSSLTLVLALCALFLAAATAQDGEPARPLWTGAATVEEDSLFGQFLAYRESRRFVSESILDGEELPAFLERLGVIEPDAVAAARVFLEEAGTDRLPAGTPVRVKFMNGPATVFERAAGQYPRALEALEVLVEPDRLVAVGRGAEGFVAASRTVALETRYVAAAGEITVSLFAAAQNAGVPRDVMIRFADVFAFDVDFAREIYRGDRFEIVYEERVDAHGRVVAMGEIVFAALTWKGGTQARGYYRFVPREGAEAAYYAADGRNPRTLLMKSPINGARVTSRFGRRRHPVLGYAKGHKGIDFGAPTGTPVMAAGDGEIELIGPRGTFGNYIQIAHANGYATAYAHLDGFAKGLEQGDRVRQGEVIGYVGATGRTTGPHLHYEVLKDGEAQDPETAKVAVGETLAGRELEGFEQRKAVLDALRLKPFAVAEARLP